MKTCSLREEKVLLRVLRKIRLDFHWRMAQSSQYLAFRLHFTVRDTARKYAFLFICGHIGFESGLVAQNDEFKAVFIARLNVR